MKGLERHKIFTMEDGKREALLTAAMSKFAKNGYKKTTTDEIIAEAGISKGLLFHYFGTKKDLYIFLFEYSNSIIMKEYYSRIDMDEKDVLRRLRNAFLIKFELINKYPFIFDFVASAYFEKDTAVVSKINEHTDLMYLDARKEICKDIDVALFKTDIDINKAVSIITFTLRGYSESQTVPKKRIEDYGKEQERYIREIDEYIVVLRTAFYKEGTV